LKFATKQLAPDYFATVQSAAEKLSSENITNDNFADNQLRGLLLSSLQLII